jgi:TonB family protein
MILKIFAVSTVLLGMPITMWQSSLVHPKVVEAVPPIYPHIAATKKFEGKVIVLVRINHEGVVVSATAIEGNKFLQTVAENAAKKWIFAVATINESSDLRIVQISFDFKIFPKKTSETELQPIFKPPYEIEVRGVPPELIFTPSIDHSPEVNRKSRK